MGADEPDIDHAIRIVDPHDDAILVTGDVEDRTAVFENAGAVGTKDFLSCPPGRRFYSQYI
jgi:hypothetical protein